MNMIIQRTIKLRLRPTPEQASILTQAIQAYTDSFNQVSAYGWTHKVFNGIELHKATYRTQRELFALPSQLAISARMKATEALVSVKALLRKGKKAHQPQSLRCPIRYDQRSYGLWFDRSEVSLLTLQGRLRITFTIAKHYQQYKTWQRCSADVIQDRKGRWWLHVVMSKDIQEIPPNDTDDSFVGVDLGIVNPAADSRGQFYGSEHWEEVERKHAVLRSELQSKGTRSAKRKLKRTSGRQRRFRRDCDHVLSKRLVQTMESGQTLVFENLTDIRGRVKLKKAQRKRLHKWSFAQLQTFVEYKAQAVGVSVVFVDPRYTSQKCSQCKHVSRSNRPEQSVFKCRVCKFTCHADHNAAINIRANYLQFKGLSVNQPIVATQGDISFG
ncbi:MAG: transposase [Candidatus Sericytochromatia bacterium]|nr:transposase [Candidatus Sericytochromatia bacterium]